MRSFSSCAIVLALTQSLLAGEPKASAPDIRETIQRSIGFLEKDSLAWKEERRCASCHHLPMTLWSLNEAKKQGYAVNDKTLTDLTAWTIAKDDPAKVFPKRPPTPEKLVNQSPLLLALGIEAGDPSDLAVRKGLKKLLTTVLVDQGDDGSWKLGAGRLPMVASKEIMTTLTLLALSSPAAAQVNEAKPAQEKALKWLSLAPPEDDLQAIALRIILRQRLGMPRGEWEPMAKKILRRQNADGGWCQTKEMASDAFATGQALYALSVTRLSDDPAVKKAQAFLAETQRPDGSWPMTSRSMKPGEKGAKDLGPITHAGTAWGTLGLVRSAPIHTKVAPSTTKK